MKENWKELIGKRILLRQKHLSTTSITEATVVEVSESGKFVKFRWESGSESWQVPEDEYSFSYDKILEVLGLTPEERETEKKSEEEKAYTQKMLDMVRATADGKDQTIHITFPEEQSEEESEIYNGGIYETLKPNECYLITKKGDSILVVTNKDGKIGVKWVSIAEEKEPDIVSNTLTGKIESHDDNTSVPKSKVDSSSIKDRIDNF